MMRKTPHVRHTPVDRLVMTLRVLDGMCSPAMIDSLVANGESVNARAHVQRALENLGTAAAVLDAVASDALMR